MKLLAITVSLIALINIKFMESKSEGMQITEQIALYEKFSPEDQSTGPLEEQPHARADTEFAEINAERNELEQQSIDLTEGTQDIALDDHFKKIIIARKTKNTITFLQSLDATYKLPDDKIDFAQRKISEGKKHLKIIYAGTESEMEALKNKNKDFNLMQKTYLSSIVAAAWALFTEAVEKGEGFTGGTIVIEDKDFKLFNFLFDYIQTVNSKIKDGTIKPGYLTYNCYGYARKSTHFPELHKTFDQFGIDVRYKDDLKSTLQPELPNNKCHLLFGKVNEAPHYIFVKMEFYGLCLGKDLISHLKQLFQKKASGISKKETVPSLVLEEYKKTIDYLNGTDKENILEIIKNKTIKEMYEAFVTFSAYKDLPAVKNFINYLEQNFDHLSIRRGNEVILTHENIMD